MRGKQTTLFADTDPDFLEARSESVDQSDPWKDLAWRKEQVDRARVQARAERLADLAWLAACTPGGRKNGNGDGKQAIRQETVQAESYIDRG